MIPALLFRSYADAWRIWAEFGWKMSEMTFASAQVIAHRTGRLQAAGASPQARDREEFSLMKREKVEATLESAQAMAIESVLAGQRHALFTSGQFFAGLPAFFALALPGTSSQVFARHRKVVRNAFHQSALSANKLSASAGRIAGRGLTPVRTRARANAKRLSKPR